MRAMAADSVLNICFHGIGTPRRELEPGEDAYWIKADRYVQILDEIATWPSARISFDDANASDVEFGLPALVERGLSAQFFVLAQRLDSPGSLGTGDIHELVGRGMLIGTHGMSHRSWQRMDAATRTEELVEARQLIEEVAGTAVTQAACPMGRYDRHLLSELRRLGYQRVYTSDRQVARRDHWLQPRFSVRRTDTPESMRRIALSGLSPARRARDGIVSSIKRWR